MEAIKDYLLTTDQIAEILKIKRTTIHSKEWQQRTGCPLKRIGKRNYSKSEEFYNWLARN